MGSVYSGIFAIPRPHLAEIAQLREKVSIALDSQDDTLHVMVNELYHRAVTVAVTKRIMKEGRRWSAVSSVLSFVWRNAWRNKSTSFVAPEDCQSFLTTIERLERRFGGEAEFLHRVKRNAGRVRVDTLQEAYHAVLEVLEAAIAQDAGLFVGSFDEDAEIRLARRRKEKERIEAERRKPRPPRPDMTIEEELAMVFEPAERRAMEAMFGKKTPADLPAAAPVRMLAVWGENIAEIRQAFAAAREAAEGGPSGEAAALLVEAHHTARDLCYMSGPLKCRGEVSAIEALDEFLRRDCPDAHRDDGVYTPEETRKLHAAVTDWERAQGGESAVVDRLTAASYGKKRDLAEYAYRYFKKSLDLSLERDQGFVQILDSAT